MWSKVLQYFGYVSYNSIVSEFFCQGRDGDEPPLDCDILKLGNGNATR